MQDGHLNDRPSACRRVSYDRRHRVRPVDPERRPTLHVRNVHERVLEAPASRVGELLDGLSSPEDALWPRQDWPAMRFDRPLGVGAVGGHGPIRYTVEAYAPGNRVELRFTAPRGFDGTHTFDVETLAAERTRLRHTIEMRTAGPARWSWPLLYRPLHDALLEDALDRAERATGGVPRPRTWSPWVRTLRWLLARTGSRGRTSRPTAG